MLAVSPARSSGNNGVDFLLDDIDFDNIFSGFSDGELEIDPSDIFADFSFTSASGGEESGNTTAAVGGDLDNPTAEVASARTKASQGKKKKKAKVDWTAELHRRFVQAVEELGVDKAVPSRILELMGVDCLTRHNIASHLQKYRSHRKHLLTKEAEAASWSHRRQMYTGGGTKAAAASHNRAVPPIIGFPPPIHRQPFRPVHVWGHPTVEQPQLVPVWPRPPWAPPPPPHVPLLPGPAYWHHPHYHRQLTPGTPCFSPPMMPAARFQPPPVSGIPPHHRFRPAPHSVVAPSSQNSQIQLDAQISSESIDAAIGDVLAKPWSPLPLGLKPPSLESVMVELQKQGIAAVSPTCG